MEPGLSKLALCAGTIFSASLAYAGPIYSINFQGTGANDDPAGIWSSDFRTALGAPYTKVLGRFGNEAVALRLNATMDNTAGLGGSGDQGDGGGDPGDGNGNGYNLHSRPVFADRRLVPYPDSGGGGNNPPGNTGTFNHNGPSVDLGGAVNGGGDTPGDEPPSDEPMFTQGRYALTFDLMLFDSWDGDYDIYGPDTFAVSINGETVFNEYLNSHNLSLNFRRPDEIPDENAYSNSFRDIIYRDITLEFEVADAMDHFDFAFIGSLNQGINDESWGIDNVRIESLDPLTPRAVPSVPTPASIALLGVGLGLMTHRKR